ncbi:MAG: ComEC/Rec2 family competence protein [Planctomycetes bacterium]|nr:ComEC/Rec2 family competence protein [Planctomycetota bacterium]
MAAPERAGVLQRPLVVLGAAWITGTLCGVAMPGRAAWAIAGSVAVGLTAASALRRRDRAARAWGLLAVIAVAALWAAVRVQGSGPNDVRRLLDETPRLIRVRGRIAGQARPQSGETGAFAKYVHRAAVTRFTLDLDAVVTADGLRPLTGRVVVSIEDPDARLDDGRLVGLTGWLTPISGPGNPGERNFAAVMKSHGIYARISVPPPGTVELLPDTRITVWGHAAIRLIDEEAAASLHRGLDGDTTRVALLDALVRGRWSRSLADVGEAFRRTGLMHLISVSGAHLTILAALVWALARVFTMHPAKASLAVLAAIGLYLLIVPADAPILRAGIMSTLIIVGFASGRTIRAIDMLGLSAVVLLLWRPGDVFDPGAQLSFIGVAGLLVLARPVGQWIYPAPIDPALAWRLPQRLKRFAADYLAVNIVGALVSFPLVVFHFGIVSPPAFLLSMLALPLVSALLSLALAKTVIGVLLPTLGLLLAHPVSWLADLTVAMIECLAQAPGVVFDVIPTPSVSWVVMSLLFLILLLSGWFTGRKAAPVLAALILAFWLIVPTLPIIRQRASAGAGDATLTLHALAVGDGSCYLVRADPLGRAGAPYYAMFDCGSREYPDVGRASVVPVLRATGVDRIDSLFISHADMDHFAGVLDVADAVPIGRVLTTPHLLAEAEQHPDTAPGLLVTSLRARRVPIVEVSRGWRESVAGMDMEVVWPPRGLIARRSNDTSIVLSLTTAGKRVMLTGDIQDQAITGLLASGSDLHGDIMELPHHGGFVESSPAWIKAVAPSLAVQSSGIARRHADRWPAMLTQSGLTRLTTDRDGMVTAWITRGGSVGWSSFKPDNGVRR